MLWFAAILFGFHGIIENDTTWSDTAYLTGDVWVNSDVTLTINPGTVVLFADSCEWDTAWYKEGATYPSNDKGFIELIMEGNLKAVGTIDDSITFPKIKRVILSEGIDSLSYCSVYGDTSEIYDWWDNSHPYLILYKSNATIGSSYFKGGDGIAGEKSRLTLAHSEFDKISVSPVTITEGALIVDSCEFRNSRNLGNVSELNGVVEGIQLDTFFVDQISISGAIGREVEIKAGSAVGCYCDSCQYVDIRNSAFKSIEGGYGRQNIGGGGGGGDGYGILLFNCRNAVLSSNEIKGIGGGDGEDDNEGMGPGYGGNGYGIFLGNCEAVIDKIQIANIHGGHAQYYPEGDGDPRPLVCINSSPFITDNEFNSEGTYIYIDLTSHPIIGGSPGKGNRFLSLGEKEDHVIYNNSPNDIDATWNFWECSPSMIDSLIFDHYDDPTKGIVHYDNSTHVEEESVTQPFTLRSNLVNDILHVSLALDCAGEEPRLSLFDASGRRVLSKPISGSEIDIDVSAFPRGVYFISVRMEEREHSVRKVIIY